MNTTDTPLPLTESIRRARVEIDSYARVIADAVLAGEPVSDFLKRGYAYAVAREAELSEAFDNEAGEC
ncbi:MULTISPECIES: hypothetical protein [unclassified Leifsonia]|uniref:hypothetical protein n=1 Tax=unclassified Leifsonia TaxID=2663824 RepID=UPI0008A79F57|nr:MULTISPECIES: hypothetical protein [unclassified Leifsonia]SEH83965.1 hypothetical protein SAMN04515694_10530 [Leifsonia sp. CL154]SFL46579.1 hypothetical protein SAMN04515692_10529 [Leifsonia sp. CL147]